MEPEVLDGSTPENITLEGPGTSDPPKRPRAKKGQVANSEDVGKKLANVPMEASKFPKSLESLTKTELIDIIRKQEEEIDFVGKQVDAICKHSSDVAANYRSRMCLLEERASYLRRAVTLSQEALQQALNVISLINQGGNCNGN